MAFSDRVLYRRLQQIGSDIYPVEDSVNKYFIFARKFFSERFGGNGQETFPSVAKHRVEKHGLNDWAFPNFDWNPHLPQTPGAPGLMYNGGLLGDDPFTRRVFVKLSPGKWLYVGMYRFSVVTPLSPAEWDVQPLKVRGYCDNATIRMMTFVTG